MSKPLAIFLGACFLVSSGLISATAHAGDAAAGKKVFKKCKACHYAAKDKNKTGPHLVNLIGREAGTVEGYKYSKAMKSSSIVWDEDTLAMTAASLRCFGVIDYSGRSLSLISLPDPVAQVASRPCDDMYRRFAGLSRSAACNRVDVVLSDIWRASATAPARRKDRATAGNSGCVCDHLLRQEKKSCRNP